MDGPLGQNFAKNSVFFIPDFALLLDNIYNMGKLLSLRKHCLNCIVDHLDHWADIEQPFDDLPGTLTQDIVRVAEKKSKPSFIKSIDIELLKLVAGPKLFQLKLGNYGKEKCLCSLNILGAPVGLLSKCTKLKELVIALPRQTCNMNAFRSHFPSFGSLQSLDILFGADTMEDDDLYYIGEYCPNLVHLDLNGPLDHITHQAMAYLVHEKCNGIWTCSKLRELCVGFKTLPVQGLVHVLQNVPSLVKLVNVNTMEAIEMLYDLESRPLNLQTLEIGHFPCHKPSIRKAKACIEMCPNIAVCEIDLCSYTLYDAEFKAQQDYQCYCEKINPYLKTLTKLQKLSIDGFDDSDDLLPFDVTRSILESTGLNLTSLTFTGYVEDICLVEVGLLCPHWSEVDITANSINTCVGCTFSFSTISKNLFPNLKTAVLSTYRHKSHIRSPPGIHKSSLKLLAEHAPELQQLCVKCPFYFDDAVVAEMFDGKKLQKLKKITVALYEEEDLSEIGMVMIVDHCKNLKEFRFCKPLPSRDPVHADKVKPLEEFIKQKGRGVRVVRK